MKKRKNIIIAGVIITALLAFIFWYGGNAPTMRGWSPNPDKNDTIAQNNKSAEYENNSAEKSTDNISDIDKGVSDDNEQTISTIEDNENEKYSKENGMLIDESTGKDKYGTDPIPVGKPIPVEPENAVITKKELACTLSIRCNTILDNIGSLDEKKHDIVPSDGIIFEERTVVFYEGESVFNVLLREMKRNKIHLEFVNTPIYNSAYIEGIANLYEFDCGELSGWMYCVNGWFPNYGCSRYLLKEGDRVEWIYTCDLGRDIGGHYSAKNGI